MAERTFGHIQDVNVGTTFDNRQLLRESGVHRPLQAGICGGVDGAESVVLSGGYQDDKDGGERVLYTGQGGRDPTTGKQVEDQEFLRGNKGLAVSCLSGFPVRLIRSAKGDPKYSPSEGHRYDGLYTVTNYWPDLGEEGFRIWRFELRQLPDSITNPLQRSNSDALPHDEHSAFRKQVTTQRIIRNTSIGTRVKKMHQFKCQICEVRIETVAGPYAEAAHIRPLGNPHNGPDALNNILCLCPNCHVRFDRLSIYVEKGAIYLTSTGEKRGELHTVRDHNICEEYFAYQRNLCKRQ